MNNDDQLDKNLQEFFYNERIADDGFSEEVYSKLSQLPQQQSSYSHLILGILFGIGLPIILGLVVFSLATPSSIDFAAFSALALLSAYFWLEPEI